MNSFQSQVLQPHRPAEGVGPFELLLSQEQFRLIQSIMPPGMALVSMTKNPRASQKRPASTVALPDTDATYNEKRPAFKNAQNKISNFSDWVARCQEILALLKKHSKIQPFLVPVDPEALGIPDYPTIITEPMDVSTIETKVKTQEYKSFEEFDADVRKMFNNALVYNKPGTPVNKMAEELLAYYEKISGDKNGNSLTLVKKSSKMSKTGEIERSKVKSKPTASAAQPLTYPEKQKLSELIKQKLPNECLWDVWEIVAPGHNAAEEDLDFDIDQLTPEVARELQQYVYSKISMSTKKKNKGREEPLRPQTKPEFNSAVNAPTQAPTHAPPKQPAAKPNSEEESDSISDILNSDSDESNI